MNLRLPPASATAAGLLLLALVASLFYNGVHLQAYTAALGLVVIALGVALASADDLNITPIAATLAAFWAWLALAILWSAVPYTSVIQLWLKGGLVLAFFTLSLSPEHERAWRWLVPGIIIVGIALTVYATYQALTGTTRPTATFINPNSYAAFVNVTLVLVAGYLLITPHGRRHRAAALAGALLVLAYGMALTGGRGAMVSLALGLAVLALAAWRRASRGRIALTGGLVVTGLVGANITLSGYVGERVASLADPTRAGASRFLIWERAWAMLQDAPWHGTGPGTFWLLYPGYRHPDDQSGGFYAHNDYLQTAIEAGVPGFALLALVMVAVLWTLARAWRASGLDAHRRVESAALFGALLTVAAHTFLTFNLYILPTLILIGLVMARLDMLAEPHGRRVALPAGSRWVSRGAWRLSVTLLALAPLAYFTALGWADRLYHQAKAAGADGRIIAAHERVQRSIDLMPSVDTHLIGAAAVYQQALGDLPEGADDEARLLFERAQRMLALAEEANPLRPETYRIKAALLAEHPNLAGANANDRAAASLRRALELDPRYYRARVDYARFLAKQGREEQAADVLTAGLAHWYAPEPGVLIYYGATLSRLEALGRTDAAARVRDRLERTAQRLRERYGSRVTLSDREAARDSSPLDIGRGGTER